MKIAYPDRKSLDYIYGTRKYLQMKSLDDMPINIIKNIKLISLPIGNVGAPFGSYVNRMSDHYGDIDVIQLVDKFKNVKEVGTKSAESIQMVVEEILKNKKHWFSEVKAGIDRGYYFCVGKLSNGIYTPSKDLISKSEKLEKLGLLSKKELNIIKKNGVRNGNGDNYDTVFNLLRSHFILRWTVEEIKQGFKKTSLGNYKLSEAVLDKTVVKIDMIAQVGTGKYIEITNFIALGTTTNGYFKGINVDSQCFTPANLPIEVEKLYYSNFHYKPFKVVKRAFAFLKWIIKNWDNKDWNFSERGFSKRDVELTIKSYIKILKTSVNILYSVNAEISAIRIVLGKKNPPLVEINKRLDQLREPLSNVLELNGDDLDDVLEVLNKVVKAKGKEKFKLIDALQDIFKQVINFWTIAYFDQLGINPPPGIVLPSKMMYDRKIIREPWSNPVNPFSAAYKVVTGGYRTPFGGCSECNGSCGGSCGVCGGGWFADLGKSIFMKAANLYRRSFKDPKRVRQLLPGELHWKGHNFTGPGTRVDLKHIRDFPPFNNIDACSKQHDLDYVKAVELPDKERIDAINKADREAITCYNKYPKEDGYTAANLGINSKLTLAKVLPMVSKSIFGQISGSGKDKVLNL